MSVMVEFGVFGALSRRKLFALLVAACVSLVSSVSRAGEQAQGTQPSPSTQALFALIVGSNASVDTELAPLKYADDDAARYLDLFRLLGARTYLLTRLDENSRRIHPQAVAEALEPKRAVLD